MNVIFLSLDLGAPSVVEVVDTSGMKKEMFPDWTILRLQWPARGVHPLLSVYWRDGLPLPPQMRAAPAPESAATGATTLRRGQGGMVWIGTKGSYTAGRGPFAGQNTELPTPPERDWGREEVHKDWAVAVKAPLPFRLRRTLHRSVPTGQHRAAAGGIGSNGIRWLSSSRIARRRINTWCGSIGADGT